MATRVKEKERARAEREQRAAEEQARERRTRRLWQLGAAVATAAAVVIIAIVVSSAGKSKVSAPTIFSGIPQHGNVLGNPNAPVTMTEFADLQCPYCRDYTLQTLPQLVQDYVRSGKVRMEFRDLAFLGKDSVAAGRHAAAAGQQNKLWNFIDVFYNNQGTENTDYVTDAFLTKIANGAGVDPAKMLADRQDPKIDTAIAKAQQDAQQAGVNSTPTFIVQKPGQPAKKAAAAQVDAAIQAAVAGT
jgi:protein-disulfide isomerase